MSNPAPRSLNFVHRLRDRARYDEATIHSILDAAPIVHVGFTLPSKLDETSESEDWPFVMPMAHGRIDDTVYIHGYVSGRLMKALSADSSDQVEPPKAAITATIVDGLVLALTPFSNSMNYRSACVFGHGRLVSDQAEKDRALEAITNHVFRVAGGDRWADSRIPNMVEMKSTKVIAVRIEAASAKVRDGGVNDNRDDIENTEVSGKVWTGVIPLEARWGEPKPTEYSPKEIPKYVTDLVGNRK